MAGIKAELTFMLGHFQKMKHGRRAPSMENSPSGDTAP